MASQEMERICGRDRRVIDRYLKDKLVLLGKLAAELGISVKISALDRGKSGKIECKDGAYTIKINRYETRERQRFTLAHEIAHFLLHRDKFVTDDYGEIYDNVLYRSGQPEEIEHEVNRLAADLIMPIDPVHSDVEEAGVPVSDEVIERLAREWCVSKAAMEIRLSSYMAA